MAGHKTMSGTVYAIGVGPGDPELLTLKALHIIQSGALIAYPVGADSGESFAREIAAPHIPSDANEYGFTIPMRVDPTLAQSAYDEAAREIAHTLEGGLDVALLCEGDPLFYGSAIYLLERLSARFKCEVTPGITSLTACAAACNHPLATRNNRLKVLPAPMDEITLEVELANTEAAAIIKVGRHFEKLRKIIKKLNLDEGALLVEHATGEREKITPLNDVEKGEQPYFSTILINNDEQRGVEK